MDTALKALIDSLIQAGPLGVIILGMGCWIWKQRQAELALQQQLNSVQEKRVQDVMKLADAAHTFAGALERNTETLRAFVLEE
jgi:hypothetical protein